MRRLMSRVLTVGMLALVLAACSNQQAVFPAASVTQVSAVDAGGAFTVSGANFFQYVNGAGMRVEVCGVTLPAELVDAVVSEILLPPAGVVRVEMGDELRVVLPAGLVGGSGDLRIVRPDDQVTVVEGGVVCRSEPDPDPDPDPDPESTASAVLSADVTSGYAPLVVTFDSAGSSGEGALSVLWDFGDGVTSSEGSVQHTFSTPGEFTVTLSVSDETGLPDAATVLVSVLAPEVTGVTVSVDAVELYTGQSAQATAGVTTVGGASDAVTWSSTDESVLSVSESGLVTAVGEGSAEVVATSAFDATQAGRAAVRVTWHVFSSSTVLYVTDTNRGTWAAARVALEAARDEFGLTLLVAKANASELGAALAGDPDLVFYQTLGSSTTAEDAGVLVNWVNSGGRLVYGSWEHSESHQRDLLAVLRVTRGLRQNNNAVTFLDPGMGVGLSATTLTLSNAGWFTFATGFIAGADSTVLAEFSDGEAALVAGNGGRTVALGFFEDAVPAADGAVLFSNLFEAMLLASHVPPPP